MFGASYKGGCERHPLLFIFVNRCPMRLKEFLERSHFSLLFRSCQLSLHIIAYHRFVNKLQSSWRIDKSAAVWKFFEDERTSICSWRKFHSCSRICISSVHFLFTIGMLVVHGAAMYRPMMGLTTSRDCWSSSECSWCICSEPCNMDGFPEIVQQSNCLTARKGEQKKRKPLKN